MARAEQVWLHEGNSACGLMASPDPLIHMSTSLPSELSWVCFTLPDWSRIRLRAGCPWMKRSSSRAKVRARAQAAISLQSPGVNPVKSADVHINTRCSARLGLADNAAPEADSPVGPPKRPIAILPITSTTQMKQSKTAGNNPWRAGSPDEPGASLPRHPPQPQASP